MELKHLEPTPDQFDTEIVHAKFVLGSDGEDSVDLCHFRLTCVPGAHSWVRKAFNIAMEGEQTQYVWGVVDMIPRTDFPDIRNRCAIHSNNGSCMIIPREGDKVRLYIQLEGKNAIDATSGRVSKTGIGPHELLEVHIIIKRSLFPS